MKARPFRPLTSISEPASDSPDSFDFMVTGDGRPTLPHMPYPAPARRQMREAALLRPAFILYTGDAFWGYDSSRQEMLNDIDRFRALADTTGVPLYNVPGNHEMQSREQAIAILEEKGHDLYGSFDFRDHHFIALNTDEFCLEGRVADDQLEWLRWDLEQSRDAAGIFVFMHRPMFSWFQGDFNPDDSATLEELFRTHPVRGVFAAHDHFYYREEHDGIEYLTVGGGGGPLYAQPPQGGFAHYVLVSVGPDRVDYNVVEPGHLDVQYVAGNDGIEPLTIARVGNTSDRDLLLRALRFRVPRLASREDYELSLDYVDWERQRPELPVTLRDVEDMNDGSVTLSVQVLVPTGVAFRVIVEARI
jgi:hypothetical protein